MTLPLDVTLLVLLAALMHASWNAIAKSAANKLLDITTMALAGGAMCALALPFLPAPEPEAWPWLAASLLLHFLYFMALVGAYNNADLSHAYPLMRGLAPLLVAVFGVLLLDEQLTAKVWLGIALISSGILLPFWLGAGDKKSLLRSSGFALANAAIIATYTLVDGFGTRLSANALSYCLWLFLLDPLPILAVALARHGNGVWRHLRQRWTTCTLGGVLTVLAYGIVLWAMTRAPIAAVSALRETSVIFAAVIGAVFLREGFGPLRVIGAVLVVGGIAALRL
ncbi:MAG: SMR family transporter [Burkholderiales bacterium]